MNRLNYGDKKMWVQFPGNSILKFLKTVLSVRIFPVEFSNKYKAIPNAHRSLIKCSNEHKYASKLNDTTSAELSYLTDDLGETWTIIYDALLWLTLRQLILNSMSFSQARLKSPPIIIRIQDAIVAITAKTTKNLIMRISFGILNIESVKGMQLLS